MASQKKPKKRKLTPREVREAAGIPYPQSAHCDGKPSEFVTEESHPYNAYLCCMAKCAMTGACGNTAAARKQRGVRLNHQ